MYNVFVVLLALVFIVGSSDVYWSSLIVKEDGVILAINYFILFCHRLECEFVVHSLTKIGAFFVECIKS